MATWGDVRRIAKTLPGTIETSEPGKFAWSVNKRGLVWQRPLRKSDIAALGNDAPTGEIVCVRTPDDEFKDFLIASDPAVYFTTPHFDGYAAVLLRLTAASSKHLRVVMTEAWLALAPKAVVAAYLSEHERPARQVAAKARTTKPRAAGAKPTLVPTAGRSRA